MDFHFFYWGGAITLFSAFFTALHLGEIRLTESGSIFFRKFQKFLHAIHYFLTFYNAENNKFLERW